MTISKDKESHIVFLDDDFALNRIVMEELTIGTSHRVSQAQIKGFQESLSAINYIKKSNKENNRVDILIQDIKRPHIDGMETMKKVRKNISKFIELKIKLLKKELI